MAFVIKDRVKETTTTTGTGTLTLDGAATGFETFSGALGNTNTTYYAIASQNSGDFEVGIGTVGAGTLSRDTVISSSNSDALVNFTSGTKDVFVTLPASKTILLNDSDTVDLTGNLDLNSNDITGTGNINITGNLTASGNLTSLGIDDNATSTAITINSSNNIGIGTASPSSLLHIFSSEPTLIIQDGGSHGINSTPSISLNDNSGAMGTIGYSSAGLMRINQAKNSSLTFQTNNTERMRIDSSGNVGIGTSSPSSKLEVNGTITIGTGTGTYQAGVLGFSDTNFGFSYRPPRAGAIASHSFQTFNGTRILEITESGNVGIGTSSPASYYANNLVVDIGSSVQSGITIVADSTNQAMIAFADGTSGTERYSGFIDYNHSGNSMSFGTNGGSERMRIDSSGNVGIGTSSPDEKLTLSADGSTASQPVAISLNANRASGSSGATSIIESETDGATSESRLKFYTRPGSGTNPAERMVIDSSGKVGIGTSNPVTPLNVIGGSDLGIEVSDTSGNGVITIKGNATTGGSYLQFGDTDDDNVGRVYYTHNDNAMKFNTADAERMRIDSSGNVGIGTTSPSGTLEVRGSASDTSQLYISTSTKPNSRIGYIGLNRFGMDIYDGLQVRDVSASYATRFVIDSSGLVGIGTSSPDRELTVGGVSNARIGILSNDNVVGASQLQFGDPDNSQIGRIMYEHDANKMTFWTNNTERMRIDSSGNVGIGTSSPICKLDVNGQLNINNTNWLTFSNKNILFSSTAVGGTLIQSPSSAENILFRTSSGAVKMKIQSSNSRIGIGTESPLAALHVDVSNSAVAPNAEADDFFVESSGNTGITIGSGISNRSSLYFANSTDNDIGRIVVAHDSGTMRFHNNASEAMRIAANGQVLVAGTTAGDSVSEIIVDNGATTGNYGFRHQGGGRYMRMGCPNSSYAYWETNTTAGFFIDGNTFVNGTLSKSSGSFKISHPLPEKTNTHHLVHSFVEAPQADNIYRGKVDLVSGTATVNIDIVSGMTEGTFVLLNRDIQCFTSNETGWTAVKGSVSGNTLTITAQDNTCTDTISWMVIGERQDQHMYDTNWTDENGKVIVEPLKETDLPTTL